MTSSTTYPKPDLSRLADRRRFRESIAAWAAAAVLTGTAVSMAPPAGAATADFSNAGVVKLRNQYYSPYNNADITVPDAAPASLYPSPVTVAGVQGVITDVDVVLKDVSHTYPDDLDVLLVGPLGQKVVLMSDAGSSDDVVNTKLILDDEAAAGLPTGSQISAGTFKPTNDNTDQFIDPDTFVAPAPAAGGAGSLLSAFDGTDPNGTWNLFVVDDAAGDLGMISGWTLDLTTTDGTQPYPSTVNVSGLTGTVTDVDVALHGFAHTFSDDLDVMLVGPAGQRAMIMSDAGDDGDVANLELVLDDESDRALPDDVEFTDGSYRPGDFEADDPFPAPAPSIAGIGASLSVFDGGSPNGAWQLFVVDDASVDQGALEGGWSVRITTTDVAATGGTTPAPGGTTQAPSATHAAGDTAHPRVTASSPKAGADGVRRTATVTANLSEKARKGTVNGSTVRLVTKGSAKAMKATVTYHRASRTVSIDPAARLKAGTTYRVVLTTGITDLAGNALDQKPAKTGLQKAVWTFTTR